MFRYVLPRSRTTHLDWFRENLRDVDGRPYAHEHYPHLGAPGGPCDAMDDPNVRKVIEQFASRLGKTFLGQCCAIKKADCNPGPMMFASSVEKVASEVVERTYKMIENCPIVAPQLRVKARRRQSVIDFDACQCFVGWSRSASTLADKEVEFGHANEIDKWEHSSTSREADPLKLFLDRFKNRPHHKAIFEGTPTVKGKSRVERMRLQSTNCRLNVPCPHCGRYQALEMGTPETSHGVKWDKNESGKSDRDIAAKTAHYRCIGCNGRIEDEHRPMMMRRGVWCPEGCTVNDARAAAIFDTEGGRKPWKGWSLADWIEGTPARDGTDAGYQLSSLYALSLGWGDIAAEFVGCQGKPQDLRNFVNQWLAETWEIHERKQTWEQLGGRIIVKELPRGTVPEWAAVLTTGCDRQEDRYVWTLKAWGPERQSHTVAYGEAEELAWIVNNVLKVHWHKKHGGSLLPVFSLVDSGFRAHGVYEFCRDTIRTGIQLWPCKGSSKALNCDYIQATLGENTSMPGMYLFHVDTIRTQDWIDRALHTLKPGDAGSIGLHAGGTSDHQDYLEQLLNDAAVSDLDAHNNARESWDRIDTNVPNDFRDCERYAYVAMMIATRGGNIRPQAAPKPKGTVINPGAARPDGRSWV